MPAKLGLHWLRHSPVFQTDHGLLKFGDHLAYAKPTQLPATWPRRPGGSFFCQSRKISTVGQHLHDLFGGVLFLYQNVGGVEFLLRRDIAILRVIGRFQRVLCNIRGAYLRNELARQKRALFILKAQLKALGHVVRHFIGKRGLLHQLLKNAVVKHAVFKLPVLLRQVVLQRNNVAKRDIFAVHRRQNG